MIDLNWKTYGTEDFRSYYGSYVYSKGKRKPVLTEFSVRLTHKASWRLLIEYTTMERILGERIPVRKEIRRTFPSREEARCWAERAIESFCH